MATETIREYVTSLGWKGDDAGERRFYSAIEGATLRANLLATALVEMAATAANKIGAVSTQFEALYNQAQRLGTSVSRLVPIARAGEDALRRLAEAHGLAPAAAIEQLVALLLSDEASIARRIAPQPRPGARGYCGGVRSKGGQDRGLIAPERGETMQLTSASCQALMWDVRRGRHSCAAEIF